MLRRVTALLPTRLRAALSLALHTRSLHAAWALSSCRPGESVVRLPGCPGPVRFRRASSDAVLLQAVALGQLPAEYEHDLPEPPRVILDIGANVGALALLLTERYPDARIFSFEPLPDNARLLHHNTAAAANIRALPFGLGSATCSLPYTRSDDPLNFGGGGCFAGVDHSADDRVPIVSVAEAFEQLRITHVDLIKIDTEGAEHDILTSIPDTILARVRCIVGELHGKPRDSELLAHLRRWFDLELTPNAAEPKWFRAVQRQPVEQRRAA